MKYEAKYLTETSKMIDFYKDKVSPVKEYILTCHNYISELRGIDLIEIYTDLEYEREFYKVLSLVEETFRPDYFVSVANGAIVRYLDDQFIVYLLLVQNQLKKPIKWNQLIQLQFNFSMIEIQFHIKNGFTEDFTQFAVKNITLSELWTVSID